MSLTPSGSLLGSEDYSHFSESGWRGRGAGSWAGRALRGRRVPTDGGACAALVPLATAAQQLGMHTHTRSLPPPAPWGPAAAEYGSELSRQSTLAELLERFTVDAQPDCTLKLRRTCVGSECPSLGPTLAPAPSAAAWTCLPWLPLPPQQQQQRQSWACLRRDERACCVGSGKRRGRAACSTCPLTAPGAAGSPAAGRAPWWWAQT